MGVPGDILLLEEPDGVLQGGMLLMGVGLDACVYECLLVPTLACWGQSKHERRRHALLGSLPCPGGPVVDCPGTPTAARAGWSSSTLEATPSPSRCQLQQYLTGGEVREVGVQWTTQANKISHCE